MLLAIAIVTTLVSDEICWRLTSGATLAEKMVHIWKVDVPFFNGKENTFMDMLSQLERAKIARLMNARDRQRGILARVALRDILGHYCECDPRHLEFTVTDTGKPLLDPHYYVNAPRFNISHSGDMILIACALNQEVGVDVEKIRDNVQVANIIRRFFAPEEIRSWFSLSAELRTRAFFDGWTRKEAYLKARGEGISTGLNRFVVTLCPHQPVRLVSDERYPEATEQWRLYNISLGFHYSAAVAVHSECDDLRYWQWQGCLINLDVPRRLPDS